MEEDLEGRLDGERPEKLRNCLDGLASLWFEIKEMESQSLFLSMGYGDYDETQDKNFVSFSYKKLRNQYGFIGSSDPSDMLARYRKDLQTELNKLILPKLFQEAYELHESLMAKEIQTPLREFVFIDESEEMLRINIPSILDYFEIRPKQARGEDLREIAIRAYISYSRGLLREDFPVPQYSESLEFLSQWEIVSEKRGPAENSPKIKKTKKEPKKSSAQNQPPRKNS
jgi:hypothetical protein